MQPIRTTFTASLTNPNDPSEVTLVADVVGVGKTHRLASGQIVTWTADFLRAKAHTFIGKPVNIDFDDDGEATGHSRRVAGAITHAFFDEGKQVITVHAALWPHYLPATVARIKELAAENRIEVSMELIPEGELIANEDGSETPVDGDFSGMGIVRVGADPKNKVILVAALAEDDEAVGTMKIDEIMSAVRERFGLTEAKTPDQEREERNAELAAAHEGSFEWFSRRLAEHLASKRSPDDYAAPYCYVIATYPKYAIYQEGESYFRIEYARKGRDINFEEPSEVDPTYNPVEASASEDQDAPIPLSEVPPLEPTTEELRASLREEVLAELKPQLDALTERAEKAEKALTDRDAAAALDTLAASRAAELDAILPVTTDEGKERRLKLVRTLDEDGFASLKADLADAAQAKGGVATDAERHAAADEGDANQPTDEQLDQWLAEAQASLGIAAKGKSE